ncbi:hypothetical protein Bca4012_020637 [Brassica carinata]
MEDEERRAARAMFNLAGASLTRRLADCRGYVSRLLYPQLQPTIKCIAEDIGVYEKAEITTLTVRMRVHVNGLLPLITKSVVEFPNGDEVVTTIVYERLDKHCTKCLRLDHELKECLVARAEAKALKASQEGDRERISLKSGQESDSIRGYSTVPSHENHSLREQEYKNPTNFKFAAHHQGRERERRAEGEARGHSQSRTYKSQSLSWQERSSHRRSLQAKERAQLEPERSSRLRRAGPAQKHRCTCFSASRSNHERTLRGNPQRSDQDLRAIISEREARRPESADILQKDRGSALKDHGTPVSFAKQGVETGQLEEAVLQIVRASLNIAAEQSTPPSIPERVPASRRLGLNDQQKSESAERSAAVSTNSSRGRIPANQRLGPSDQMNLLENEYGAEDPACSSRDRLPATQRLGPSDQLKVVRDGKLAEGPASNSRSRLPAS